ncbi:MAG: hypothetical protein AAF585_26105 [Verrucomicrobiota bacterium]
MRTPQESRLLKEFFLNASLLALALETAKELEDLERQENPSSAKETEDEWLEAA